MNSNEKIKFKNIHLFQWQNGASKVEDFKASLHAGYRV